MQLRPLFVTGSLVHGGAERHSITLYNRLNERGHDCHAVYVKNDPSQLGRLHRRHGGRVRCLHATRFLDRAALRYFAAHLYRLRPSVLVAANGYALMYAALARRLAGLSVPLIATFHSTGLAGLREQLKGVLDRFFFWQAHSTVFVCEMQKHYWLCRGLGSRRNLVIHNGVDLEHFADQSTAGERAALRQKFGFAADDFVIGLSAVLRPEKNHLQLVEAVAALRALQLPARALLIGDGPLRADVEAHARLLGVADSVRVTGFQQDVRPALAACDVLTLCSLSETFSLAGLEGMAMGRPLVHSDVGGAAEMVFHGQNGFLFAPGDTDTLVRHLQGLAHRPLAERMGAAARRLVENSFSESRMVDRYEHLLLDACIHAANGPGRQRPLALRPHAINPPLE